MLMNRSGKCQYCPQANRRIKAGLPIPHPEMAHTPMGGTVIALVSAAALAIARRW
jgi:hypothetical protein